MRPALLLLSLLTLGCAHYRSVCPPHSRLVTVGYRHGTPAWECVCDDYLHGGPIYPSLERTCAVPKDLAR